MKYIFLENAVDTDPQHVKASLDVTGCCRSQLTVENRMQEGSG